MIVMVQTYLKKRKSQWVKQVPVMGLLCLYGCMIIHHENSVILSDNKG